MYGCKSASSPFGFCYAVSEITGIMGRKGGYPVVWPNFWIFAKFVKWISNSRWFSVFNSFFYLLRFWKFCLFPFLIQTLRSVIELWSWHTTTRIQIYGYPGELISWNCYFHTIPKYYCSVFFLFGQTYGSCVFAFEHNVYGWKLNQFLHCGNQWKEAFPSSQSLSVHQLELIWH